LQLFCGSCNGRNMNLEENGTNTRRTESHIEDYLPVFVGIYKKQKKFLPVFVTWHMFCYLIFYKTYAVQLRQKNGNLLNLKYFSDTVLFLSIAELENSNTRQERRRIYGRRGLRTEILLR